MAKNNRRNKVRQNTSSTKFDLSAQPKLPAGEPEEEKSVFPKKFPFWARLKIGKNRPTLVIDEEETKNTKTQKMEPGFVHRESIHSNEDGSNVKGYEKIVPNPDPDDKEAMYLKGPSKKPKRLFKPHEKNWPVPQHLIEKYDKNNKK